MFGGRRVRDPEAATHQVLPPFRIQDLERSDRISAVLVAHLGAPTDRGAGSNGSGPIVRVGHLGNPVIEPAMCVSTGIGFRADPIEVKGARPAAPVVDIDRPKATHRGHRARSRRGGAKAPIRGDHGDPRSREAARSERLHIGWLRLHEGAPCILDRLDRRDRHPDSGHHDDEADRNDLPSAEAAGSAPGCRRCSDGRRRRERRHGRSFAESRTRRNDRRATSCRPR